MDLDPEGLTATGRCGEAHYSWSDFTDVEEDAANLYLFVDRAQAFTLPKSAVGSGSDLAQVREWLAQASSPTRS